VPIPRFVEFELLVHALRRQHFDAGSAASFDCYRFVQRRRLAAELCDLDF
jgi:hypothetical protein